MPVQVCVHSAPRPTALLTRLTGQLLQSSRLDAHKIADWHAHDGLLLLSEHVFKMLLDGHADQPAEDSASEAEGEQGTARQLGTLLLDPCIIVIDEGTWHVLFLVPLLPLLQRTAFRTPTRR